MRRTVSMSGCAVVPHTKIILLLAARCSANLNSRSDPRQDFIVFFFRDGQQAR